MASSSSQVTPDSLIGAQCFVDTHEPWCYGEVLIVFCGLITLIFSIWVLYRMFKYQNEAKSAVRSFIIYLSICLSMITILHALFIDGSVWSLSSSFLVSVQCSLFTVFFIKICIRTNSDTLTISMDCERYFQMTFLLIMIVSELGFFIWSTINYDGDEIDCHSPPFMAFSLIDVVQILLTIIAVLFIKRKITKQHQKVIASHSHRHHKKPSKRKKLLATPPMQPLSVNDNEPELIGQKEQESLGQIQMLQKSHQLLKLVIIILICAVITTVYEIWNFETERDCKTFIAHQPVINEVFRLIARITWLFIPSWMIIYVFWIWPIRPKKYISDDSMRRRELERIQYLEKRDKILTKLCCYCFTNENESSYNHMNNGMNGDDHHEESIIIDQQQQQQQHRSSMYNYEADNRLIDDMSINRQNDIENIPNNIIENKHKTSLADYTLDDQNNDYDGNIMYNRQISDDYNDSSSSIEESDSMRRSDIWDQHITTENIETASNVLSGSIAQKKLSQMPHQI